MGTARSRFPWYADGTRQVFAVPGSVLSAERANALLAQAV
jgi:hypothetical protein